MTPGSARRVAVVTVAATLVAYPLAVSADGVRFPSVRDCVRRASPGDGGDLDLVFGRRQTPAGAQQLLERVRGVGYVDAEMRMDGCGRWEVLYDGIESYAQGASSAAEAHGAGLDAWLEIQPPR